MYIVNTIDIVQNVVWASQVELNNVWLFVDLPFEFDSNWLPAVPVC